jgi:hypothetical protein
MTDDESRQVEREAPHPAGTQALWPQVLRVAWLAILLGLGIELLLLAVQAATGHFAGPKPLLVDLVQKVSWSFLVCVGLAFGTAATKSRPQLMGLLGLLSAPLAFNIARSLHKGAAQALSLTDGVPAGASPFLIALLKAVEYGFLGWMVGKLSRRPNAGAGAHLAVGLALGLTFGTAIVLLLGAGSPEPTPLPDLLARGINELFFPIGCALALYAAGALARRSG